jgi:hypothetical protein
MSAFEVQGDTVTFTAATTPPTAVQAVADNNTRAPQYLITNVGSVAAFVGYGQTAAAAAAAAVVPTSTPSRVYPVLPGTQVVISAPPGAYFTGDTSSDTAVIYVTPGYGE